MPPATNWSEKIAPDEEARFADLAQRLGALQKAQTHVSRGLHAKAHAGLIGRLQIPAELPAHLKQGLFARAGEHHAYVRFSNGSGARQHDREPDLRGLAIKVLGVDGQKALGTAHTQDFLFIDSPSVPFRTPEQFITFIEAAADRKKLLGRLVKQLGLGTTLGLMVRLLRTIRGKRSDVADLTYYGSAAIKFGPHAGRLAAFPVHAHGTETGPGSEPDYLGTRLRARVTKSALVYELKVQLFVDDASTSIEDSSRPWAAPFETVGRLKIDRQNPGSESGTMLQSMIEQLSFDPWHALIDHQPLGEVMRARKSAYFTSVTTRVASAEPDGSEWASFQDKP